MKRLSALVLSLLIAITIFCPAFAKEESTEWVVLVDTSMATILYPGEPNAITDPAISAIEQLEKDKGENDKVTVYTFDTDIKKNSDYKNIKAKGQDTAFYASVKKYVETVNSSKADKVVAIMFTDGVETVSKTDKAKKEAENALKDSKVPVNAIYPSKLDSAKAKELNDLVK
ncbi:MAG: hypothetical protein MJ121_06435, partial [Clostridia bacterium]|nr:hypothetical protein [Clostridia bacterium]